jgi:hypothetical protein
MRNLRFIIFIILVTGINDFSFYEGLFSNPGLSICHDRGLIQKTGNMPVVCQFTDDFNSINSEMFLTNIEDDEDFNDLTSRKFKSAIIGFYAYNNTIFLNPGCDEMLKLPVNNITGTEKKYSQGNLRI